MKMNQKVSQKMKIADSYAGGWTTSSYLFSKVISDKLGNIHHQRGKIRLISFITGVFVFLVLFFIMEITFLIDVVISYMSYQLVYRMLKGRYLGTHRLIDNYNKTITEFESLLIDLDKLQSNKRSKNEAILGMNEAAKSSKEHLENTIEYLRRRRRIIQTLVGIMIKDPELFDEIKNYKVL